MLSGTLENQLATAAQPKIEAVLAGGGSRTSRPTGEVSAVRTMTLDGFEAVANAWTPILRPLGYRVEMQAVFCHSRPQVTFNRVPSPHAPPPSTVAKGRCELADLLVVIDHKDKTTGAKDRRAVLVQAKLLKGGNISPSGKEWIQHELLAWLPPFDFVDTSYLAKTRDLISYPSVGNPSNTADYGGIDLNTNPTIWSQWLMSQTKPCFTGQANLGPFLAGMATGKSQFGREAVDGGSDDWSFTVDELLRVTGSNPIVKRTPKLLRGSSAIAGFIVDTAPDFGSDGPPSPPEGEPPEWPGGPMSTVRLAFNPLDELE